MRARPPFVFWACLWLVPFAPSLWVVIGDLAQLQGISLPGVGQWIGRDFTALWLGGKQAAAGGNPYDLAMWFAWNREAGIVGAQYYLYPPHSLLYAVPLAHLPYPAALFLWTAVSAAALYLAAKPVVPFDARLTLIPAAFVLFNGQYGALVAALWLWAFHSGQARGGIATGILTLKPHLGILLGLAVLFRRHWEQAVLALTTCAILVLLAEVRFGLLDEYLTQATVTQWVLLTDPSDQAYFRGIPSTYVALRGHPFALTLHLLACAASVLMLWRIRQAPFQKLCFPLATATFIVLPYSFGYDMIVVSIGFAALLYDNWTQLRSWERGAVALAFAAWNFSGTLIAPVLLLAGLYVQVRQVGTNAQP